MKEYCAHIEFGEHDTRYDYYTCGITGKVCVASSFVDGDPGHPASYEYASYCMQTAEKCPAFCINDDLAALIKEEWSEE